MADYQNLVTSNPITDVPPATPDTEVVWFDGSDYYIRSEAGVDKCISCGSTGTEVILLDKTSSTPQGNTNLTLNDTWINVLATYSKIRITAVRGNGSSLSTTIETDVLYAGISIPVYIWANAATMQMNISSIAANSFTWVNAATVANRIRITGII